MVLSLSDVLSKSEVDFVDLKKNYAPLLSLVKELIGVVPNCDKILEIWPVGFQTYNLIVPNFLNLPFSLWGKKNTKEAMGLAMYASSMAANCPYCSAHTCSFALRRGVEVKNLLGEGNDKENAIISFAQYLSKTPTSGDQFNFSNFSNYFSKSEIEQIAFSVSMMGFLNKFMDSIDVELEPECIADVGEILSKTNWKPKKHVLPNKLNVSAIKRDNLFTYFRVIKHAPRAILLEKKWTENIPKNVPDIENFLIAQLGYGFPLLKKISKKRVARAIATILIKNLDINNTAIGINAKCLSAFVFLSIVENKILNNEFKNVSRHFGVELDGEILRSVLLIPMPINQEQTDLYLINISQQMNIDKKTAVVFMLVKSISYSPAQIDSNIVKYAESYLTSEEIVEVVVWISIQQMLHRLYLYFEICEN